MFVQLGRSKQKIVIRDRYRVESEKRLNGHDDRVARLPVKRLEHVNEFRDDNVRENQTFCILQNSCCDSCLTLGVIG